MTLPDFDRVEKLLRFGSIICGLSLIPSGVFGLLDIFDPMYMVVSAYLCLFGALILLAEMRNAYFLENFKFLLSYPGRGAFYVFCGSLALANTGKTYSLFQYITGAILCTNGVGNFVASYKYGVTDQNSNTRYSAVPQDDRPTAIGTNAAV